MAFCTGLSVNLRSKLYNKVVYFLISFGINAWIILMLLFGFNLSCFICSLICNKVVYFLSSFGINTWIILMLLFGFNLSCFICSLICLPLCRSLVVWQFMLRSHRHSQSDIPSNAGLYHTTNILHQYSMPFSININLHIPICGIHGVL